MNAPSLLLSAECQATADALRHVRTRLVQLVQECHWPEGSWPDIRTVQEQGLSVIAALESLASEPGQRTPGPYDADERR